MKHILNYTEFTDETQQNLFEKLILEHRNDLKPIICIIIGVLVQVKHIGCSIRQMLFYGSSSNNLI